MLTPIQRELYRFCTLNISQELVESIQIPHNNLPLDSFYRGEIMHDEWLELIHSLAEETSTRIILLVLDGLGDAPFHEGKTALESAKTPNLDLLASRAELGLGYPVGPGITPGSGPGHLALFGYDPIHIQVGRGVLSALGVDFELQAYDIAARGNFCTVDPETGFVIDRRAGRIPTDLCIQLTGRLQEHFTRTFPDVQIFVLPEKEHRFALIIRSEGFDPSITDTDPQVTGQPPLRPRALKPEAEEFARFIDALIEETRKVLADQQQANMILLRGFDRKPDIPLFPDVYKLKPIGIAEYPMYRGLARLVGIPTVSYSGKISEAFKIVQQEWENYTFFFVHVKKTDSYGEDGNFTGKVKILEEVDHYLPMLMGLKPDVLVITGDHSTPALIKAHSWHAVPYLLSSPYTRYVSDLKFTERDCARGTLGRFPMRYSMSFAMAHAGKLKKFGA